LPPTGKWKTARACTGMQDSQENADKTI